jgi:hypothetical protein
MDNITPVVESIALWLGAFVGIQKLVDWFLSEKHKEKLAYWATKHEKRKGEKKGVSPLLAFGIDSSDEIR